MTAPSTDASNAPIGAGPDGFTTLTLGQQLEFWARETPDHDFLVYPDHHAFVPAFLFPELGIEINFHFFAHAD